MGTTFNKNHKNNSSKVNRTTKLNKTRISFLNEKKFFDSEEVSIRNRKIDMILDPSIINGPQHLKDRYKYILIRLDIIMNEREQGTFEIGRAHV